MYVACKKSLFAPLLAAIFWSTGAWSMQFNVVDQNGAALANAVVSIPGATNTATATDIAVMDQRAKQFAPYVLAINQGQKVEFPNSDNIRHHVYSFSSAKPFEIKLYKGVPGKPMLFNTPGLVVLGCNIHDKMVGYIYVSESPVFGVTASDGSLALDLKNRPSTIEVWHPDARNAQQPATVAVAADGPSTLTVTVEIAAAKLVASHQH